MNDIKIGQLYKHTPTGIVKRLVFADSNHVTFKEDATFTKFYCSIDDFKSFGSLIKLLIIKLLMIR